MSMKIYRNTIIYFTSLVLLLAGMSCNDKSKPANQADSMSISGMETIPDSVVQFLISSATMDFRNHQPPTPVDFRNIQIGYLISSDENKIFVLCGEFQSKENLEKWETFATIKTSGYEQYIGNQAVSYCQQSTFVVSDKHLTESFRTKMKEDNNTIDH